MIGGLERAGCRPNISHQQRTQRAQDSLLQVARSEREKWSGERDSRLESVAELSARSLSSHGDDALVGVFRPVVGTTDDANPLPEDSDVRGTKGLRGPVLPGCTNEQ